MCILSLPFSEKLRLNPYCDYIILHLLFWRRLFGRTSWQRFAPFPPLGRKLRLTGLSGGGGLELHWWWTVLERGETILTLKCSFSMFIHIHKHTKSVKKYLTLYIVSVGCICICISNTLSPHSRDSCDPSLSLSGQTINYLEWQSLHLPNLALCLYLVCLFCICLFVVITTPTQPCFVFISLFVCFVFVFVCGNHCTYSTLFCFLFLAFLCFRIFCLWQSLDQTNLAWACFVSLFALYLCLFVYGWLYPSKPA